MGFFPGCDCTAPSLWNIIMEKDKAIQLFLNIQMSGMEKGRHPGTCPMDPGMPSKQKGSRSWARLTDASCWPCSQSPESRAATCSLCRVESGLKTIDLKHGGQRGWEQKSFTTNPPHLIQWLDICRCQKCGQVKISLSAFGSQGTRFNQSHI